MYDLLVALVISPLAGATLKLADILSEKGEGERLCFMTSSISGSFIGSLITLDRFSSAVFFGIILGVLLAGKIDRPCLVFGLMATFLTVFILGYEKPDLVVLGVSAFASFMDEKLHDRYQQRERLLKGLFKYRFVLKLTIILIYLIEWLPLHALVIFYLFDLTYDLSSITLNSQECHTPLG